MSRGIQLCTFLALAGLVCGVAAAGAAPGKLATPNAGPAGIEWRPVATEMGLVLTVSGPQGFYLRQEYGPGQTASFSLFDSAGAVRSAGSYKYELRAVPQIDDATRAQLQAARESGTEPSVLGKAGRRAQEVQSGAFAIADGTILMGGESEPGAGKPAGGNRITTKDQVIPDDLIVQGSACIGIDCVNNENFGFDTIRMKENNTRIDFTDTSTTTGFPSQDWEIAANDSASGGRNALIVSDENTQIFVIESGNIANALYVELDGDVGFGTSNPVLDLHISTSNTPAIRLEQTNAGGFTAQTWDIAGNEANFFVRDVTGGSLLPFRIRPGAPTSSIDIANGGNVGIGTASPTAALHVSRNTGALLTAQRLTNNAGIQVLYDRTDAGANDWQVSNFNTLFEIGVPGATPTQFSLNQNGDLTIGGTQYLTGSSRDLKENFVAVDSLEILERVVAMPLTEWNAKTDPAQRHIGPVAEDWYATFGLGPDDKHVSPTDIGGVALAAIKGLYQELQERDAQIVELQRQLEELAVLKAAIEELRLQQ